jgi:uncharacterized XkdX family phage protein
MYYTFIKKYYLMGLYTDTNLDVFVGAKMITTEQKAEIIASKTTTVAL